MARPPSGLRGQILESALTLFATRGYKGTSLHDISEVAGCSKAALLYHFTAKDAILGELLAPVGEKLADLDARLSGLDGEEAARTAVAGYVDLGTRFRRELKLLFEDIPAMTSHPELGAIPAVAERLVDALAGRSADPGDQVAAYMVLGAVVITAASDVKVPHEDFGAHMTRAALRTLGREPR